jgi:hypothetical protein
MRSQACVTMLLAAITLLSSSAQGAAFFIGQVDVMPFANGQPGGFTITSTGAHSGFPLMTGNAVATEMDTIQMGSMHGASGPPFGIAAASATGTQTVTMTNDNPIAITTPFEFQYFAFLGTGAGTVYDSARAGFTINFSTADGSVKGSLAGPNFVQNNDPSISRTGNVSFGQFTFAPDQSKSFILTYSLDGLARTDVPEPASAIPCGAGIVIVIAFSFKSRKSLWL